MLKLYDPINVGRNVVTTTLLPRGSRFGDLRLTGFVGSGGFSDVYEAYDKHGRRLAVKVLRLGGINERDQQDRINRERVALQRIDSRGVARLVTADLACETPWIASEFIDGPTIRESIAEHGPLSPQQTLSIIRRLAEILSEIHAQGIAHRDITPNNVIFSADGPVFIDFGSAKIDLESKASGSVLVAGTVGYLPPEVERNEPVGRKGDVYALARVAQFCLSGKDDIAPNLPPSLKDALDSSPGKRPSAEEVAAALVEFIEPVTRYQTRQVGRLPRRYRPRTLAASSLITGLIVFVTSIFLIKSDSGITTEEILLSAANNPAGESWSDGLFAVEDVPPGWVTERIRPIDSIFGHTVGDLDAFQVRFGDVEEKLEKEYWAYGQMKVSLWPGAQKNFSTQSGVDASTLPKSLQPLSDNLIDLIELSVIENGCVFRRANNVYSPAEGRSVWASVVSDCGDMGRSRFLAGLMWDESSDLVAQWILETNFEEASQVFPTNVSLRQNFRPAALVPELSWEDVTALSTSEARIGWLRSKEDFSLVEYGIAGVVIPPGEGIQVENQDRSDVQVSFYIAPLESDFYNYSWTPAGRWWGRQAGEQRIISNSTSEPLVLYVEAEAAIEDGYLDLRFHAVEADSRAIQLEDALGGQFREFAVPLSDGPEYLFQLPSNPPSSSDSSTSLMEFKLGDSTIKAETELPGATVGTDLFTFVSRADDTGYDSELTYFEAHNPHFMLMYAPAAELILSSQTTDWVFYPRDTVDCSAEVDWQIPRGDVVLNVSGRLHCYVEDTYYLSVRSITHQANPIFKFSLGSTVDDDQVIAGSFAPASAEELVRFQRFLAELLERSEEILANNPAG